MKMQNRTKMIIVNWKNYTRKGLNYLNKMKQRQIN